MSRQRTVVARIKGGLGNQLFCYAAARRLAWTNDAELVVDDTTGFRRDRKYRRSYQLDHFRISARKATPAERLEPFERLRRAVRKWASRRQPFETRSYLEQESLDFDERLLSRKVEGSVYLDGLWLSDRYFHDAAPIIREDLRIIAPADAPNREMGNRIVGHRSVALHVRWFDPPGSTPALNITRDYYQESIALLDDRLDKPHYFIFSDNPEAARQLVKLPPSRSTLVNHNRGDAQAYADLWLMSLCQHAITANSSFSWWGAWLGRRDDQMVIAPDLATRMVGVPDSRFLIPDGWIRV